MGRILYFLRGMLLYVIEIRRMLSFFGVVLRDRRRLIILFIFGKIFNMRFIFVIDLEFKFIWIGVDNNFVWSYGE